MSTKAKIRWILYGVGFLLPMLALFGCDGFNEGSMKVSSCFIGFSAFEDFANAVYGFVLVSAFMLGIPILLYIGAVVLVTEIMARAFGRRGG
ncbi:hypothetical protein [Marinobacterium rhizophilum]|uniref:hypothetical protein n=1 Tax=Marinobacterium rhizophilum TaxID=420402 RepID=UPI000371A71F|nr:hypothetical protein [Marinobacterium rhizophilum]